MNIFKYLAEENLAKQEKTLETLVNFFDALIVKREYYNLLDAIIKSSKSDYDTFREMQKTQISIAQENEFGEGIISRIKDNIERANYLQEIEEFLVDLDLNLLHEPVKKIYQLSKIVDKEGGRIRAKKSRKCFFQKEISRLYNFFNKYFNDYKEYFNLKDIIKANKNQEDYTSFIEMQRKKITPDINKKSHYHQQKDYRISKNFHRGLYLQIVHTDLIKQNLKFQGKSIKTIYQLIKILQEDTELKIKKQEKKKRLNVSLIYNKI